MATATKIWEIFDGGLKSINTSLSEEGRTESGDLEKWIESNPEIIGDDISIIGRQVRLLSGSIIDLLGVDKDGDLVVIELKRDRLSREIVAQAIDYASEVADWDAETLSEKCKKFEDINLEDTININAAQRIMLVGFGSDSALERMVKWLSERYGMNINAVILNYAKTSDGAEILTRTSVIPEEVVQERTQRKRYKVPKSDEPGNYDDDTLRKHLSNYLSGESVTVRRIREILLPELVKKGKITRGELVDAASGHSSIGEDKNEGRIWTFVSAQLGHAKNDFLRQVVNYDSDEWRQKDNFSLREEKYRGLLKEILEGMGVSVVVEQAE